MDTNSHNNTIHTKVTAAIQSGTVQMRSSFHFVWKTAVLVSALIGIFIFSSAILNYIVFTVRIQSHHELLGFGVVGMLAFLHFFPWALFCIDIALAVLVVYLLQSFRLGYKTPHIYVGALLCASVILVGLVFERMGEPLNLKFMERMEAGGLPVPLPLVMGARDSMRDTRRPLCKCEVVRVTDEGRLIARDLRSDRVYTFILPENARYATTTSLVPGDRVIILGHHDGDGDADDVLDAYGIKKLPTPYR